MNPLEERIKECIKEKAKYAIKTRPRICWLLPYLKKYECKYAGSIIAIKNTKEEYYLCNYKNLRDNRRASKRKG